MGLRGSLTMLLLSMWLFCLRSVAALDARALDALLQDYAYKAFVRPRTGVVYDGTVPSNLSGIHVSALRLRSGSFRKKGVSYKEFEIPVGVLELPYTERLVLVYQNLGNWSVSYYPLPPGYVYLAPVLGLLAYDASNLMAENLPELDIRASGNPIAIKFSELRTVPDGLVPKCVLFDSNGSVNFSNMLLNNICTTFGEGHFSIVVESIAPSPAPVSPVPLTPPQTGGAPPQRPTPSSQGKKSNTKKVWKIVGSAVGGFALLVLLGLLVVWGRKYNRKKKMQRMERAAEVGESLHMTTVGDTRAPSATGTRTQPTLETEYVP